MLLCYQVKYIYCERKTSFKFSAAVLSRSKMIRDGIEKSTCLKEKGLWSFVTEFYSRLHDLIINFHLNL